jgi:hypothetical protein
VPPTHTRSESPLFQLGYQGPSLLRIAPRSSGERVRPRCAAAAQRKQRLARRASDRAKGLQSARSQSRSPHTMQRGSTWWTVTRFPQAVQENWPFAKVPAGQNSTYSSSLAIADETLSCDSSTSSPFTSGSWTSEPQHPPCRSAWKVCQQAAIRFSSFISRARQQYRSKGRRPPFSATGRGTEGVPLRASATRLAATRGLLRRPPRRAGHGDHRRALHPPRAHRRRRKQAPRRAQRG